MRRPSPQVKVNATSAESRIDEADVEGAGMDLPDVQGGVLLQALLQLGFAVTLSDLQDAAVQIREGWRGHGSATRGRFYRPGGSPSSRSS